MEVLVTKAVVFELIACHELGPVVVAVDLELVGDDGLDAVVVTVDLESVDHTHLATVGALGEDFVVVAGDHHVGYGVIGSNLYSAVVPPNNYLVCGLRESHVHTVVGNVNGVLTSSSSEVATSCRLG